MVTSRLEIRISSWLVSLWSVNVQIPSSCDERMTNQQIMMRACIDIPGLLVHIYVSFNMFIHLSVSGNADLFDLCLFSELHEV